MRGSHAIDLIVAESQGCMMMGASISCRGLASLHLVEEKGQEHLQAAALAQTISDDPIVDVSGVIDRWKLHQGVTDTEVRSRFWEVPVFGTFTDTHTRKPCPA